MEQLSVMRHGPKLAAGELRSALPESGLSAEDQARWAEAVSRLGIEQDPQLAYHGVPLIRAFAKTMYSGLPSKAIVMITSTGYPRTRLTADFLATELETLAFEDDRQEIAVASLWGPTDVMELKTVAARILGLMVEVAQEEKGIGAASWPTYALREGDTSIRNEDEVVRRAVNQDLASQASVIRPRLERFREQVRALDNDLRGDRPIHVLGVGHHLNVILLDLALHPDRKTYASVEEMPGPLTRLDADKNQIARFLNERPEE